MKQMSDTTELLIWFNPYKEQLKETYRKRLKLALNVSNHIKKSIAYHVISEQALEDEYTLTDCQLNKLALLIVMEE